jgi:hypothetical protein
VPLRDPELQGLASPVSTTVQQARYQLKRDCPANDEPARERVEHPGQ